MNDKQKLQEVLNQIKACDKKYIKKSCELAVKYKLGKYQQDKQALDLQKEEEKNQLIQKRDLELDNLVKPSAQNLLDTFLKDKVLRIFQNHGDVKIFLQHYDCYYSEEIRNKIKDLGLKLDKGKYLCKFDFTYGEVYLVDEECYPEALNTIHINYVASAHESDYEDYIEEENDHRSQVIQIFSEDGIKEKRHHEAIMNGCTTVTGPFFGQQVIAELVSLLRAM